MLREALRERFGASSEMADLEFIPLRCLGSVQGRLPARLGRFTLFNTVFSDFGASSLKWPLGGLCSVVAAANESTGVHDLGPGLAVLSVESPAIQVSWEPPATSPTVRRLEFPSQSQLSSLLPVFQVPWPSSAHFGLGAYQSAPPLQERPLLAALVGNAFNPLRARLRSECERAGDAVCAVVGGVARRGAGAYFWRNGTSNALHAYRRARFCLQPWGDTATRKAFFDALSVGCINVVFGEDGWNATRAWFGDLLSAAVMVPMEHVSSAGGVLEFLRTLPSARVRRLHHASLEARGRVQYVLEAGAQKPVGGDAVDTIVRNVARHFEGQRPPRGGWFSAEGPAKETRTRRGFSALRTFCRFAGQPS